MCLLQKTTYLEWGNEYDDWDIIPAIHLNFNSCFSITFTWLKIQYSHTWDIITFEEEDARARVRSNLNNNNDESSSV